MRALLVAAVLASACTRDLQLFDGRDDVGIDAGLAPGDPEAPDARGRSDASRGADAQAGEPPLDVPPGFTDGSPSISGHRVLAAFGQTCALHAGELWCWGDSRYGQRGSSGVDPRVPARIDGGPFSEVCTGEAHTCALRTDGVALCWGANANGELGVGDRAPRLVPTRVTMEPSQRFVSIACGGRTSCGIDAAGELSCWGDNTESQLGALLAAESVLPVRVAPGLRVGQVSVGQAHLCAVALGGGLWCWGRNTEHQAGASSEWQVRAPIAVDATHTYQQVGAGQRHSCAIRQDGRLLCWGDAQFRLLGSEPTADLADGPQPVGIATDYAQVVVGWFHSCARKHDGSLHCWGRNAEGQLGVGDTEGRNAPARVLGLGGWTALAVGHLHTCATDGSGVACWGQNDLGQLGLGDLDNRAVPALVPLPLPPPF